MKNLHIILDAVNPDKVEKMDYVNGLKDDGDSHFGKLDCGFPGYKNWVGAGHTVSSGLSLITGQTPTKGGKLVNRFFWDEPAIPAIKFSSHREIDQDKFLWDYMTKNGVKQGWINIPTVYPPENVNGFMIGGVMSVGRFAYPKSLEDRLRKGYVPDGHSPKFPFWNDDDLKYMIDFRKDKMTYDEIKELGLAMAVNRTDHALALIDEYDPDYMFIWYTSTDRIFHHASMHGDDGIVDMILATVDEQLEKLIGKADPDHLIVHSDHGMHHSKNTHRRYGFYLLNSPYKFIGKDEQHILDIPPTVMSALGLSIPSHYEGTTMLWSDRDQQVIEGRLTNMGYMEE